VDYVESYTMFAECFDSCIVTYFEGSPSREATKIWFIEKNTTIFLGLPRNVSTYVPQLTEEYSGPCGHGAGWGQAPSIFIGDVALMNIHTYIHRFD
jgi:hypothetical protein